MKTTGNANITISKKTDVTSGREKVSGGGTVISGPNAPKSLGAPKDVTENQFSKKDMNIKNTNAGKVTKV